MVNQRERRQMSDRAQPIVTRIHTNRRVSIPQELIRLYELFEGEHIVWIGEADGVKIKKLEATAA
jgi:hypothetical protein